MRTYKQLTLEQRYHIAALKKVGCLNTEIALEVETSKSTICREFQRNTGKRGYRPLQAQIKADRRKQLAAKAIKMTSDVIDLIEGYIRLDWSPDQVSNELGVRHDIDISHEAYLGR